jgi:hypothetical protein
VLASAIGAYLGDEALLEKCAERWKFFIGSQIAEDGSLPHEVTRSEGRHGLWYSHFCLMPQVIAAEILKENGKDLYDYRSPEGRTLQLAYEKLVPWVADPETFFYWEGDPADLAAPSYYSYWDEAASKLLLKARPMNANHSTPYLTLTHGKALKE